MTYSIYTPWDLTEPEVNRTLATLRKAELGFLGLIVEKSTDKSSLLSLYRTIHEFQIEPERQKLDSHF